MPFVVTHFALPDFQTIVITHQAPPLFHDCSWTRSAPRYAGTKKGTKKGSSNILPRSSALRGLKRPRFLGLAPAGQRHRRRLRHHPTFGSDGRNRRALPWHTKCLGARGEHPERCARSAAGEAGGVERSRTASAERRPFSDIAPIVYGCFDTFVGAQRRRR